MVTKRQRDQRKNATAASVQVYKKRRLGIQPDEAQLDDCHNDQPSDTDTDQEARWFWDESANESQSDSAEEGDTDWEKENGNKETKQPKTDEPAAPKQIQLVWKEEAEKNKRGTYGAGSRSTRQRQRNKAKALEKEASQSYQIDALWQRQQDLGLVSSQTELASSPPLDNYPLSQVPRGKQSKSKEEIQTQERNEALQTLTRLLQLVTEQEKKYGERLSPHSNFYRRHVMVQQFLQAQLRDTTGRTRKELSQDVARCFGRGGETSRNITRWEKSWIDNRVILEKKNREDYESWMDDEDLKESIRNFARKEGDRMF